jgi:hypothetical protein
MVMVKVMSKVTNSYASAPCTATPPGGGWAWPSLNTVGWPRGCGCAATGQARRPGRYRPDPPRRLGQPRCVAPRIWSRSSPQWRWAFSREGGPR